MRKTHNTDRIPIQQSLTVESQDYSFYNLNTLMLGVVLSVYPSDSSKNPNSERYQDRQSFDHKCSVLVINDGSSTYMTLNNVIIPPPNPSSVWDYSEYLPKGSSGLVSGDEFNDKFHNIDPSELDGEWCVVGYLGGSLDVPFVISWWPNLRNTWDPATSGEGLNQNTLKQSKRYFRRVNGVEHTITSKGDIILSTTFANSRVQLGKKPVRGRQNVSTNPDTGGSIISYIKPSQVVELTWDEQRDGLGPLGAYTSELPQKNPPQIKPRPASTKTNMFISIDKDVFEVRAPERVHLKSKNEFEINSTGVMSIKASSTVDIASESVLTLDGSQIKMGPTAVDAVIKGTTFKASYDKFLASISTIASVLSAKPAPSPTDIKEFAASIFTAVTVHQSEITGILSTKSFTE